MRDDDTYDEYGVNTRNSFNTPPKGTTMRVVTMKIDGITVAVMVEHQTLQGKDFDELCTALLLTIANQTGKVVSKEVQEGA